MADKNSYFFVDISPEHAAQYKEMSSDKSSDFYDKVAFINDGSGIITRGQLYINSSYWVCMANTKEEAQQLSAQAGNENKIYFVPNT